jgi:arylsulfatase A
MNQRPNIVLILADDMGYGDLSCLNDESGIDTPHMDRLASEGMTFTDAHASSSVCTPSRYGILTGRYAWRGRLQRWVLGPLEEPLIEEDVQTLPGFLSDQGYHTACNGKWHLGMDWPFRRPCKVLASSMTIVSKSQKVCLACRAMSLAIWSLRFCPMLN